MTSITLNGETTPLEDGTTVQTLLEQLDMQDKRVAVEINQEIVSRSTYAEHLIAADDTVEIVQAIGGG